MARLPSRRFGTTCSVFPYLITRSPIGLPWGRHIFRTQRLFHHDVAVEVPVQGPAPVPPVLLASFPTPVSRAGTRCSHLRSGLALAQPASGQVEQPHCRTGVCVELDQSRMAVRSRLFWPFMVAR